MSEAQPKHELTLKQLKERKELAEAELAALTAEQGTAAARMNVPPAGMAGSVTLGQQAGAMETALLTGHAVKRAARVVATEVLQALSANVAATGATTAKTPGCVLVVPAGELPTFKALTEHVARGEMLRQSLVMGNSQGDAAVRRLGLGRTDGRDAMPVSGDAGERAAGPLASGAASAAGAVAGLGLESVAGVGLALQAATAVLGYFKSDFALDGRTVPTDDALLVRAVAGALLDPSSGTAPLVHLPGTLDVAHMPKSVERLCAATDKVAFQRRKAAQSRDALATEIGRLTDAEAALSGDADVTALRRTELARRRVEVQREHDALHTLISAADAYLAAPIPAGDGGAALVREWCLWERLQEPDAHLLVLKMEQAGGSSFTVKNLWTAFGRMPYHVSAGVVVSYQLFVGVSGALRASGVVPMHGGFITPRELAWREP